MFAKIKTLLGTVLTTYALVYIGNALFHAGSEIVQSFRKHPTHQ